MPKKRLPETDLLSFKDALERATAAGGKKNLLLGNGFSIGAHPAFHYGALFEQAKLKKLPKHITALFSRYGTTNFESILRYLDEGAWLADHYKLKNTDKSLDMKADYVSLKNALVDSISKAHPSIPSEIGDPKLQSCSNFIESFDDVYSLNYDLLLYWAALIKEEKGEFPFKDFFGREEDTDESCCVFLPTSGSGKHLYFLHGALHLFADKGDVYKRVWRNTGIPLLDQIRKALDAKSYPLVVSEGKSQDKKLHIETSSYLSYCWRKFENIQGNLFIYGHSLCDQDQHLLDAIHMNTGLENLFIGIHGHHQSKANIDIIQKGRSLAIHRDRLLATRKTGGRMKKLPLTVRYFKSKTAHVWDGK